MVEEVIKLLVTHVEDKMRYKADRIHTLTKGPKIVSSCEELDRWYRERSIKRTAEEISESTKKKIRVSMIKATDQKEPLRYEDEMEEQGYKIGGQGEACKIRKDHKIW